MLVHPKGEAQAQLQRSSRAKAMDASAASAPGK